MCRSSVHRQHNADGGHDLDSDGRNRHRRRHAQPELHRHSSNGWRLDRACPSGVDDPLRLWLLDVSWGAPDPAFQPGHQRHADLHDALHAGTVLSSGSLRTIPSLAVATSTPVTVTSGASSAPPTAATGLVTLVPSSTTVGPSGTVTVTVSNSSAMPGDYVAIAPAGSTTTHIAGYWLYMNGLQTAPSTAIGSATLTFTMPPDAGQYQFRLYANDTFNLAATSAPVTVDGSTTPPPPDPSVTSLTPLATTATADGTLSLSFTDSQATVGDWIALAQAGSTTPYVSGYWMYLGGLPTRPSSPVTSGTLTFRCPPRRASMSSGSLRTIPPVVWPRAPR